MVEIKRAKFEKQQTPHRARVPHLFHSILFHSIQLESTIIINSTKMANCCGGSGVDKEAQRQNKLISKQLHDEKKGLENEIKLLLLGIKHVQSHIYWFKSHFSPLVFRIERERESGCLLRRLQPTNLSTISGFSFLNQSIIRHL